MLCANFGVVDELCESRGGRAAVDGSDGPEVIETGLDVAERRRRISSLHELFVGGMFRKGRVSRDREKRDADLVTSTTDPD